MNNGYLGSNCSDRDKWQTADAKPQEKPLPSSDPILPFSSSPANVALSEDFVFSIGFGEPIKLLAPPFNPQPTGRLSEPLTSMRRVSAPRVIPVLSDTDDKDLPDVS